MGLLALCAAPGYAAEPDWADFPDDASGVNEGPLQLLDAHEGAVLAVDNRIVIDGDSLDSGWVSIDQCYRQMDPVSVSEIDYRYRAMRDLRVTRVSGIGAATVEGSTVQLTDVGPAAILCITLEARILERMADGRLHLSNGPFHRRFLDGYYPMRVRLEVDFAETSIADRPVRVEPDALPVQQSPGRLAIDVLFEGMLTVEIYWEPPGETGTRGPKASSNAS